MVLPAAAAAYLVGSICAYYGCRMPDVNAEGFTPYVQAGGGSLCFVTAGAWVAPRRKNLVSITLLAVITAFGLFLASKVWREGDGSMIEHIHAAIIAAMSFFGGASGTMNTGRGDQTDAL